MAEQIIRHSDDEETKCPMCGWRVFSRFRLEPESPDVAVCGDCFVEWLLDKEAEVTVEG